MENAETFEREPVRLNRKSTIALLIAAILAAAYIFGHPGFFLHGNRRLPGVGLAASTWLFLAACILQTGTTHLRRSLFPLCSAALLAGSFAVFGNESMKRMNLPVLIGLVAVSAHSLACGTPPMEASALRKALSRLVLGLFPYVAVPACALRDLRREKRRGWGKPLLQGLLLCIIPVGLVLILLSDADADFAAIVSRMFSGFQADHLGQTLWKLLCWLLLTLLLFGFLYGLNHWRPGSGAPHKTSLSAFSLNLLLGMLNAIYLIFICIQIRHLSHAMDGNYAVVARAGFFQLVLVALITTCVVLPSLALHGENRLLRALCALAALLTMGILASAVWRMALYIRAYGWTLLRIVTLWGMLSIFVAMVAACVKSIHPSIHICAFLATFAVASWLLLNYANVDLQLARLNVSAWQRGKLEQLDLDYLETLSPDVLPALRKIDDESMQKQIADMELYFYSNQPAAWYDWSACWCRTRRASADRLVGEWQIQHVSGESVYPTEYAHLATLRLNDDMRGCFMGQDGEVSDAFHWTYSDDWLILNYDPVIRSTLRPSGFKVSGSTLAYIHPTENIEVLYGRVA